MMVDWSRDKMRKERDKLDIRKRIDTLNIPPICIHNECNLGEREKRNPERENNLLCRERKSKKLVKVDYHEVEVLVITEKSKIPKNPHPKDVRQHPHLI